MLARRIRNYFNAGLFVGAFAYVTLIEWWSGLGALIMTAAANTIPIWGKVPDLQWIDGVLAANTTKDLTAGTSYLVHTAPADGSYVQRLRIRPKGTNVATVMRIFLNNGSTTGTAANNSLFDEITLPATTVSEVAAQPTYEVPMNLAIPAGYKIYVTVGTVVAAGFMVTAVGAKY